MHTACETRVRPGPRMPDRVVTNVVDLAGDEATGHGRGQSMQIRFRPTFLHDRDGPARIARVERRDLVSVALPPIQLNCTPSQSAATLLIVRLRAIVLPLIDQGISPPPPVRATFPPIVSFLSRTVFASVAVMFPCTVMVVCPVGQRRTALPRTGQWCLSAGSPCRGASPERR